MCTVSWWCESGEFHLLFNRDELTSRKRALPPEFCYKNGQTLLMPIDSQAGGTWIGAGSAGLLLCLLNYYPSARNVSATPSVPSRGHLIPRLLARSALAPKDLEAEPLRPFDLLAFDFRRGFGCAQRQRWDGQTLENLAVPPVLSSSSYLSRKIEGARIAYFKQLEQSQSSNPLLWHLLYHTSHPTLGPHPTLGTQPTLGSHRPNPGRATDASHSAVEDLGGAASVCMHRDIEGQASSTQSLTHIRVQGAKLQMDYFDGPPCIAFDDNFAPRNAPRWFRQALPLQL